MGELQNGVTPTTVVGVVTPQPTGLVRDAPNICTPATCMRHCESLPQGRVRRLGRLLGRHIRPTHYLGELEIGLVGAVTPSPKPYTIATRVTYMPHCGRLRLHIASQMCGEIVRKSLTLSILHTAWVNCTLVLLELSPLPQNHTPLPRE